MTEIEEKPVIDVPVCRMAKCTACGKETVSDVFMMIPRFRKKPNQEFDSWYCGCQGSE
jgi:hypothetical protein